ncbi:TrlF family AAA-like ATPase [Kineobactrum salinum]|uniref:AAA family ATPase n=1 Tax=Kineobactrum salinum TaxID=2708301 RepID=A0A6C0TXA9_9GAMM|nr:AAA family ATPase [Kineobactrum salinum]QIB64416.1 AAA family ATPase [Kineobactrum salinum]
MIMNTDGSTWKRWDLHVHTPESMVHNYPGEKEAAWAAFLTDLESLPKEFKVLGINDYLFVDGYARVLREKINGRLANIDLLLPVIELRVDKFGGVIQGGRGKHRESSWSRVNLHVIFDQVDPDFIRQQFLSAISPNYNLVPGASGEGKWNSIICRESLEALGEAIIQSVSENIRHQYGPAVIEGFNNLNVSLDGVKKALQNHSLAGKFLVAVGKTEWENLKWDDHTIAEKKTLINEADLVFTAAESPEAYLKARRKLQESQVNAKLFDCSDAHWLSSSTDKDRVGNCFTWIKADSTFKGLIQAIHEYDDRVFIGGDPPKRKIVQRNKTKFIGSVRIEKLNDSSLAEQWFDSNIPLNSDLVAIIGNKGSGKSALSDIIALAGNTKHHKGFSFLNDSRFRNKKSKFSQHFMGSLTWLDGKETFQRLDTDPDPSSVERVKYLPQSYLEDLCNQLGDGGSATFDAELRKIIYSHVPEADKLGKSSMDELLQFKVVEINEARRHLREVISEINSEVLEAEKRGSPEFKAGLEAQLTTKRDELSSLEQSPPQVVEDPNESDEALAANRSAAQEIEKLEQDLMSVDHEKAVYQEQKLTTTKKKALVKRISQSLENYKKQYDVFLDDLKLQLSELEVGIPVQALVELRLDIQPLELVAMALQEDIDRIDGLLESRELGSLSDRREKLGEAISEAKSQLGERQRQFVLYREALSQWESMKSEIIGTLDRPGSIIWLEKQIESLAEIPALLDELRVKRRGLSGEIHGHIQTMVNEYQWLYEPVQAFVASEEQQGMSLPLHFHVQIEQAGFQDQFLGWLNRQVRGSFSGVEESYKLVREIVKGVDFSSTDDAVAFAEMIDDMLHFDRRDDQDNRFTRFEDQLRKGASSQDVLDYIYGFEYLSPKYSLTYDGQDIGLLSPGERGLLLLVFYLLVDKDDIPIIIDQPEENLDNQTIFRILVKCLKKAKARRQVIMVTHNPNLAVVCDAEQIIYASCDKMHKKFQYESGAIENPRINARVVEILEGTAPAFKNRQQKYRL